ncbi:MAG TPA: hypothetical protein VMW41_04050 [Candidatus Bathyarchaeia archaeon]|nr:hypothetical protein [Candidatus Bathyarchaeia archaeon]
MKKTKKRIISLIDKIKAHSDLLIVYGLIISAALAASIASSYITGKIKSTNEISPELQTEQPSLYPDYDAIKSDHPDPKIKILNITKDCPIEGCINSKPATIEFDGIKKNYKVVGEFARAYLYIEALVDHERPLTSWDDFYFTLNNQGGHLISQENSLPVPPSNSSRYLYDLRSISYYPTIRDKERKTNKMVNVDFFHFLKDGYTLNIWVSVSSNRPGRVMKEVSIYYECLEGSECSIEEK